MTTEEQTQGDSAADPQRVEEFYGAPDEVLTLLVDVVNRTGGLEVGVTLHVAGTVVSGLLVSGQSFFDLLHAKLVGTAEDPGGVRAALGGLFERLAADYRDRQETPEGDDEDPQGFRRTVYVHLRDATVHAPGMDGVLGEDLWRGRLSQVDGWSLGNFGTKAPLRGSAGF